MINEHFLAKNIDAVIFFTWSDWHSELRSNRYHYATRFARHFPVIFVQPDSSNNCYEYEQTEIPNLKILHLPKAYDLLQLNLFNRALLEEGIIKPLFWIYNVYFENIVANRYSVINIYHGTEDYLSSESLIKIKDDILLECFYRTMSATDLVITVSDGVKNSFEIKSRFEGPIRTVTNGCDSLFYSPSNNSMPNRVEIEENTALYQGNIFNKIDYDLMCELAEKMPDWTFKFCGKVVFNDKYWKKLCSLSNVVYLGLLPPTVLREECYKATVGIIPFIQSEWLVERSFPLKTFEYLASGLPVVTIPIKSILPYSEVLMFARDATEFENSLRKSTALRVDQSHLRRRLCAAAQQDYDIKFSQVIHLIEKLLNKCSFVVE